MTAYNSVFSCHSGLAGIFLDSTIMKDRGRDSEQVGMTKKYKDEDWVME